jgi:hypothetical protein
MKRLAIFLVIALPLVLAARVLVAFTGNGAKHMVKALYALNIDNERVRGNGVMKDESRDASSPFTNIATSGAYKVVIEQGNTHSIRISAEENLLPYITTEISGKELSIGTKKGYNVQPTKDITVYVTLEKVNRLSASGAGGFTSKGTLTSDHLELGFSGAADANLDIRTQELKVGLSGASNIKLRGNSESAEYGISGTADISALDLPTKEVKVSISGTGSADVFVQKELKVVISGMGKVKYKGEPSVIQSISGMGRLSKI